MHSYKDLPTAAEPGLTLAAVPAREDPRDALVARDGMVLGELPPGAVVGTGSPRRVAQLRALGLGLEIVPIRGNVDTRIDKVTRGELDGVVVARAGLARLGRVGEVTEMLDPVQMLPAPAQGALAVRVPGGGRGARAPAAHHPARRGRRGGRGRRARRAQRAGFTLQRPDRGARRSRRGPRRRRQCRRTAVAACVWRPRRTAHSCVGPRPERPTTPSSSAAHWPRSCSTTGRSRRGLRGPRTPPEHRDGIGRHDSTLDDRRPDRLRRQWTR